MNINRDITRLIKQIFLAILMLAQFSGCVLMPGHGFSECEHSSSPGLNLGFEEIRNGLPTKWLFKTERVINNMSKSGDVVDFDFTVDSTDKQQGRNSIRYEIRKCNSNKENMDLYAYYPGFFDEFDAISGATYKVSFWVKNNGCDFEVRTSAVREMGGPYCEEHTVTSKDSSNVWKQYSLEQEVCRGMKFLRIETSIRSTGSISFDGFSFEKIR